MFIHGFTVPAEQFVRETCLVPEWAQAEHMEMSVPQLKLWRFWR